MTHFQEEVPLTELFIPKNIFGETAAFQNYDPNRIKRYEVVENGIKIYMHEMDRLEAIREYQSTIEAFQYEVERGVREETISFLTFDYDFDYEKLTFVVNEELYKNDISAKMIERSIVGDALMAQIYSKKNPYVEVKYVDGGTRKVFEKKVFPE